MHCVAIYDIITHAVSLHYSNLILPIDRETTNLLFGIKDYSSRELVTLSRNGHAVRALRGCQSCDVSLLFPPCILQPSPSSYCVALTKVAFKAVLPLPPLC